MEKAKFRGADKREVSFKASATPEQIDRFIALVKSGQELEQAAMACWIAPKWAAKNLDKQYKDALTDLRLELFGSLRKHIADNAPAAIFAAKAKLGWQDVQKIEQTSTVDYIDVPASETRQQWEARQGKLRAVK